jgi:hypothetical protein
MVAKRGLDGNKLNGLRRLAEFWGPGDATSTAGLIFGFRGQILRLPFTLNHGLGPSLTSV